MEIPCKSAHCFNISRAFEGATVESALPCQTDIRGQARLCAVKHYALDRPTHERSERETEPCL